METATRSVYYRRRQVQFPAEIPGVEEDLERFLAGLPKVELEEFLRHPADFYNWGAGMKKPGLFECSIKDTGRTAVLSGGFEQTAAVRSFTYQPLEELREFEPETLAGPLARLSHLAEALRAKKIALPSLTRGVVVFTGLKHGSLKQAHREILWRAFQVPVYEQFRGFGQELLAWECEARDGLHIETSNALFEDDGGELRVTSLECREYPILRLGTELEGRIARTACGCGEESPRLIGVRAFEPVMAGRAMAASAR